jgi:hypothetical protein
MEPNIDEYGVEWRKCTVCGRWKELEREFALCPGHTCGLSSQCKQCCRERERERYHRRKAERENAEPRPELGEGSVDEEGNWSPDPALVEWMRELEAEKRADYLERTERQRLRANAYRRRRRMRDPSYCRSRKERGFA